jgi:uncharacterized cupredoxin-like copper-binding protein
MQRLGFTLSGLLLMGVLVTSACTGGEATTGTTDTPVLEASASNGVQHVTVTVGNSMTFDPAAITVHAGQPVQLTLRNAGLMPHDFSLSDGVAEALKIATNGGQSASGTFTIDTPGTYSFDCSMPGHAAAGMRGTITAQ